jgi:hypothetical protein
MTEEGPKLATILAHFLELNPATRIGERKYFNLNHPAPCNLLEFRN